MPFQPTNRGYDTYALKKSAPPSENGYLKSLKTGDEYRLWINEVTMEYGMGGSVGQSFGTRSYFPHNINEVSVKVTSQFPNQELYADVVEFVRTNHLYYSSSMLLQIPNQAVPRNQSLKGAHASINAEGYVGAIRREHKQHEYAPSLTFEFIVERFLAPEGWRDESVKIRMIKTWKQIIEQQAAGPGFITNPDTLPTSAPQTPSVQEQATQDLLEQVIDGLI